MKVERPLLLQPKEVLNLHSSHHKQLFHGAMQAKWGFMVEFNQMYNEGLALLSDNNITITFERMDRFMQIMASTYYPGEEPPCKLLKPRTFLVTYLDLEVTMTIAQIMQNWPVFSGLVEDERVSKFTVMFNDEEISVKRLSEIELEPC